MADRITNRDLEQLVRVINRRVNGVNHESLWWRNDAGELVAYVGDFYIDGAYGGVALYRVVTAGGGVSDVFNVGHVPKRDLYGRITAYLRGLEDADAARLDRAVQRLREVVDS